VRAASSTSVDGPLASSSGGSTVWSTSAVLPAEPMSNV
jgi:hypothetical protein